jgi:hypothetical protein
MSRAHAAAGKNTRNAAEKTNSTDLVYEIVQGIKKLILQSLPREDARVL